MQGTTALYQAGLLPARLQNQDSTAHSGIASSIVQAIELDCIALGVPVTASWMKQRHSCYPTNQACTVGACAWHTGRTHWYCVQTFGLQRFPMGIVDVLQVEVIVVLAQPGFLQGMVWGLQQKRQCGQYSQLPCTAAPY